MEALTLEYDRRPSAVSTMLRGAWPSRRRAATVPPLVARWRGHRIDRDELAAFRRIVRLPDGPDLPLVVPLVFGFRLPMAILTHPAFPVPIWGVLQTRDEVVAHRPIAVGATLDLEARAVAERPVAKGTECDVRLTAHDADGLAWEATITFFWRGPRREGAEPLRSPTAWGPEVAAWAMDDAAHWQFGRFTGDYNGLHLFDAYARRFGFPGAFYHPSRVLAQALGHLPPGRRLEVWLKGPVRHGATARLHAARGPDDTTFAVFAEPDRPALVGRVA